MKIKIPATSRLPEIFDAPSPLWTMTNSGELESKLPLTNRDWFSIPRKFLEVQEIYSSGVFAVAFPLMTKLSTKVRFSPSLRVPNSTFPLCVVRANTFEAVRNVTRIKDVTFPLLRLIELAVSETTTKHPRD